MEIMVQNQPRCTVSYAELEVGDLFVFEGCDLNSPYMKIVGKHNPDTNIQEDQALCLKFGTVYAVTHSTSNCVKLTGYLYIINP